MNYLQLSGDDVVNPVKKMEKQIENWGLSPDDVKPLTYDANGNIFEGF